MNKNAQLKLSNFFFWGFFTTSTHRDVCCASISDWYLEYPVVALRVPSYSVTVWQISLKPILVMCSSSFLELIFVIAETLPHSIILHRIENLWQRYVYLYLKLHLIFLAPSNGLFSDVCQGSKNRSVPGTQYLRYLKIK